MEKDEDSKQEATGDGTAKEDAALNGIDDNVHANVSPQKSNDLIIDEGFPVLNTFIPQTRSTKPSPNPNQKQINSNDRTNNKKDCYDPSIIPRYPFAAFPSALTIHQSQMTNILSDFQEVFDARTKEDSAAYSTGSTYFMPACMKPRCALEYLALSIFKSHTEGLVPGKHYDLGMSGAEWWTLVLDSSQEKNNEETEDDDGGGKPKAAMLKNGKDVKNNEETEDDDGGGKPKAATLKNGKDVKNNEETEDDDGGDKPKAATLKNGKDVQDRGEEEGEDDDDSDSDDEQDEIGMHFDADYGIEEQLPNFMIHPRVATVTYLSDVGVPTLILNKRSPPSADVQKLSLNGPIDNGWLSCPMIGKHIAFDGRFLHGSPGEFFPDGSINKIRNDNCGDDDGRVYKRQKLDTEDIATIIEKQSTLKSIQGAKKRITFMVNVWLNHCPLDAEPVEDDLIARMKTAWEDEKEEGDSSTVIKSATDTIEGKKEQDAAVGIELNTIDKNCKKTNTTTTTNGETPPFRWSLQNVKAPSKLQKVEITGIEKMSKWAGSETSIICNREVVMQFRPTMEDCHRASRLAFDADGKSIELSFQGNALCLEVGDEVVDSSSDEEAS